MKNLYATVVDRVSSYLWPDRSADPEHIAAFKAAVPLAAHLWSGDREDSWYLDLLCTHPDFEGKGHGSSLVKWGIGRAGEEGICASVIAAWAKDPFYERFGFKEAGRADVGPIAGVKGGAVMFKDKKATQ
jgi:GNAT superfamily N-acetyltransferase